MPEIKLARLPDRSPVKISISMMPDLNAALLDYARFYAETYGRDEAVADLIPAMLTSFVESDRAFAQWRRAPERRKP